MTQISLVTGLIGTSNSRTIQCAIYTRKSSTEGLDSAFNSLDAQREACSAYIASQIGEGWRECATIYEDGGLSGGSLDRPALQRLLEDISAGRIQVVVVHKVDRLTRSLADFAKLVELFDRAGARFVSVTQAFNTTTSMGRLTLNTLLSFAQFEREIASERIRDKKEASSKKGLFVGGMAMLGYDLRDKKLVVNEREAEAVRYMFARYLALKSTSKLLADLNASEYRPKSYKFRTRKQSSATWYSSNLVQMLRNRRYVGEVKWGNKHYAGVHEPIVSREIFDSVQQLLDSTQISRRRPYSAKMTRLLSGLLFDDKGCRMISRRTGAKDNPHWGNYVSYSRLHKHATQASLTSVRVSRLEPLVLGIIRSIADRVSYRLPSSPTLAKNFSAAIKSQLAQLDLSADRQLVLALVDRVTLGAHNVVIDLKPILAQGVLRQLPTDEFLLEFHETNWRATATVSLGTGSAFRSIEFPEERNWKVVKRNFSRPLLKALHLAHQGKAAIESGKPVNLGDIARAAGVNHRNYYRLLQLAYLAPDLQQLILEGRQPPSMCVDTFLSNRMPVVWEEQRIVFGLANANGAKFDPLRRRPSPRERRQLVCAP